MCSFYSNTPITELSIVHDLTSPLCLWWRIKNKRLNKKSIDILLTSCKGFFSWLVKDKGSWHFKNYKRLYKLTNKSSLSFP